MKKLVNYPPELKASSFSALPSIWTLDCVTSYNGSGRFGHYIARCKKNDQWIEFNDELLQNVQHECEVNDYVLFYRRKR